MFQEKSGYKLLYRPNVTPGFVDTTFIVPVEVSNLRAFAPVCNILPSFLTPQPSAVK